MHQVSNTLVNLLYLLAIAIGLYLARREGASPESLLIAACTATLVVFFATVSVRVVRQASK